MAMKKVKVYSDQEGLLYFITSYKKALSFFKNNKSIDTFTVVEEKVISEAKLKEMRISKKMVVSRGWSMTRSDNLLILCHEAMTLKNALADVQNHAKKIKTEKDFSKWYLEYTAYLWENNRDLYYELQDKLKELYHKNPDDLFSAQYIWRAINEIDLVIWKGRKIKMIAISARVLEMITPKMKRIFIDIAKFIEKLRRVKKLDITVGDQSISVAGRYGFRVGIPPNGSVSMMFNYVPKVTEEIVKLEKDGHDSLLLWAAFDFFHEIQHTFGIQDERKCDREGLKLLKKFLDVSKK